MSIVRNQGFAVEADYVGELVQSFELVIDKAVVQAQPASGLVEGVIRFPLPDGLPKGSYVLSVAAVNAEGRTVSDDLVLTVTGLAPAAPSNLRIVTL
jgi:hypothetical protein